MVTEDRNRGQLILVAAIAIAFIIIGVVVVFNGVLYTQTLSAAGTSASASDAQVSEYELERGIQGVIQRENLDGTDPKAAVEEFGTYYSERKATKGASIIDLEFNEDSDADGRLARSNIQDNESVAIDAREIGHFTVSTDDLSGQAIVIEIESNSGSTSVDITGTADDITIEVDSLETCTVKNDGRITFDFVSGAVNAPGGSDCAVDVVSPGVEYDEIDFGGSDDVDADFALVVSEDEDLDSIEEQESVHWTADVTVSYHSSDVSYERTETIDVYGDRE